MDNTDSKPTTAPGNDPGERTREWLGTRLQTFGPLLALATVLSAAGWLLGTAVALPTAMAESTMFFRIVLAGAVMAVLRNEVGLRTYGLFAPVVIAFIMLGAGPVLGLVLFVNVLVVTLLAHRALRPLKLGTAPRVAVLLSVAGLATALAFAAAGQGLLPVLNTSGAVFFPTIISAWYADRAASEIEERGWAVPARRLLGTLVAVVLSYAVIANEALVGWFVATPAAWGGTLVLVAYLGSRPSFRLSEYRRFGGHFEGRLGPLSVVRTRVARVQRSLARLAGRDVAEPLIGDADVLAMKRRNKYIEAYNPAHLRPAADEKAHVNKRLTGLGVASPRTYAVVASPGELDAVDRVLAERDAFVLKPSKGYGGEGIVVVSGREGDTFDTSKGPMTGRELRNHARRIVDGHYSGLESAGQAIVEEKLTPAQFMRDLHGDGVADVRVIVFQGYPVMAMTRLPTEASDGAANLHLGAVGVGLSVADGTPLGAFQQSRNRELDAHPDTGASLTDFRMPNWDGVLETAVEAAAASGLGYTGVDVVLAEGAVPKVLEVNVRPGLGIQNTTDTGLLGRLSFVEALPPEFEYLPADRKLALAREWARADFAEAALPSAADLRELRSDADRSEADDATGGSESPDGEPAVREGHATAASGDAEAATNADPTDTGRSTPFPSLSQLGGGVGSSAMLVGAGALGFPVVTALFVLVAVGFVAGLCVKAYWPGGS